MVTGGANDNSTSPQGARDGSGHWIPNANPAWESAFYQFAEGLRVLTHGAVNHKALYALVGTRGRYVNHANPAVRKRTASNLSRLIHTSRYALDMRARRMDEPEVFDIASQELCAHVRTALGDCDSAHLEQVLKELWDTIRSGLAHECAAGRADVSLERIDHERAELFSWFHTQNRAGIDPLPAMLAAFLHVLAFGHLDERHARSLVASTPLEVERPMHDGSAVLACREYAPGGGALPSPVVRC